MTSEIRYARNGEYHIAYRVDGDGSGGIDVLRIGAYVFSLALQAPAARPSDGSGVRGTRSCDQLRRPRHGPLRPPARSAAAADRGAHGRPDRGARRRRCRARTRRRRSGRRSALVPLRGHVPRPDAGARADEHGAAHRVGPRLSLGDASRRVRPRARGDGSGLGNARVRRGARALADGGHEPGGDGRVVARVDAPFSGSRRRRRTLADVLRLRRPRRARHHPGADARPEPRRRAGRRGEGLRRPHPRRTAADDPGLRTDGDAGAA